MAKKCELCGSKIETTFLGKFVGTKIGKKFVCNGCQSKYKDDLKKKLGS
ncbi:MAG: hypothetical protein ABIB47_03810 [Candidatus Woesearchaeota archaeon]